mgnify:CR=1 FL=1
MASIGGLETSEDRLVTIHCLRPRRQTLRSLVGIYRCPNFQAIIFPFSFPLRQKRLGKLNKIAFLNRFVRFVFPFNYVTNLLSFLCKAVSLPSLPPLPLVVQLQQLGQDDPIDEDVFESCRLGVAIFDLLPQTKIHFTRPRPPFN